MTGHMKGEDATIISSREQLAFADFAKSLLVTTKTLAVNAAKDAIYMVAKLIGRTTLPHRSSRNMII